MYILGMCAIHWPGLELYHLYIETRSSILAISLVPMPTLPQVEGRWLTIQLATSHRDLVLPTDPLRLSLYSIGTRDSGDVDFVLFEK